MSDPKWARENECELLLRLLWCVCLSDHVGEAVGDVLHVLERRHGITVREPDDCSCTSAFCDVLREDHGVDGGIWGWDEITPPAEEVDS